MNLVDIIIWAAFSYIMIAAFAFALAYMNWETSAPKDARKAAWFVIGSFIWPVLIPVLLWLLARLIYDLMLDVVADAFSHPKEPNP